MLSRWPTWRRIALTTVLCLAVALTITALVQGLAPSGPLRALEVLGDRAHRRRDGRDRRSG